MVDTPLVYPAGSCGMLGIVTSFEIEAAPVREVVQANIVVEADLRGNARATGRRDGGLLDAPAEALYGCS